LNARHAAALTDLVQAKLDGKSLPKPKKVQVSQPNDLLAALRESAAMLKPAADKPNRTAANATTGTGRQRAARGAAA
ncbi:Ku protein, partial [Rhizobium ruizarguesonis]